MFICVIECRICAISLIVIFLYCYHGVTLILVSTGPRYPVILGGGVYSTLPAQAGKRHVNASNNYLTSTWAILVVGETDGL